MGLNDRPFGGERNRESGADPFDFRVEVTDSALVERPEMVREECFKLTG